MHRDLGAGIVSRRRETGRLREIGRLRETGRTHQVQRAVSGAAPVGPGLGGGAAGLADRRGLG